MIPPAGESFSPILSGLWLRLPHGQAGLSAVWCAGWVSVGSSTLTAPSSARLRGSDPRSPGALFCNFTVPLHTASWSSMPLPAGAGCGGALYVPLMGDDQRPVDPSRPVYVWQQVADHIASRIEAGELQPGARLEGERELAEARGVGVGRGRRAVGERRERGQVVTLPAKGTYVADRPNS